LESLKAILVQQQSIRSRRLAVDRMWASIRCRSAVTFDLFALLPPSFEFGFHPTEETSDCSVQILCSAHESLIVHHGSLEKKLPKTAFGHVLQGDYHRLLIDQLGKFTA
jgi:hypothetical protein